MLSYLKGTALDWFKLSLTSSKSLPWLNNYSNKVRELKNNFRPHDPKGKAKANLKNLKMCDNQCIMKYLVDFNRLAARVQWGDAALCWQMYRRLLSHIKDEIACIGKPNVGMHWSIPYDDYMFLLLFIDFPLCCVDYVDPLDVFKHRCMCLSLN